MNAAGNAMNHPERMRPDVHQAGAPLPRGLFANDVGYLPDGTPMNRAGNALNHPAPRQHATEDPRQGAGRGGPSLCGVAPATLGLCGGCGLPGGWHGPPACREPHGALKARGCRRCKQAARDGAERLSRPV